MCPRYRGLADKETIISCRTSMTIERLQSTITTSTSRHTRTRYTPGRPPCVAFAAAWSNASSTACPRACTISHLDCKLTSCRSVTNLTVQSAAHSPQFVASPHHEPIAPKPRFFELVYGVLHASHSRPSPLLKNTTRPSMSSQLSSRITSVTRSPSSILAPRSFSTTPSCFSATGGEWTHTHPVVGYRNGGMGTLSRLRHKDGIAILKRRKLKGRKNLSW